MRGRLSTIIARVVSLPLSGLGERRAVRRALERLTPALNIITVSTALLCGDVVAQSTPFAVPPAINAGSKSTPADSKSAKRVATPHKPTTVPLQLPKSDNAFSNAAAEVFLTDDAGPGPAAPPPPSITTPSITQPAVESPRSPPGKFRAPQPASDAWILGPQPITSLPDPLNPPMAIIGAPFKPLAGLKNPQSAHDTAARAADDNARLLPHDNSRFQPHDNTVQPAAATMATPAVKLASKAADRIKATPSAGPTVAATESPNTVSLGSSITIGARRAPAMLSESADTASSKNTATSGNTATSESRGTSNDTATKTTVDIESDKDSAENRITEKDNPASAMAGAQDLTFRQIEDYSALPALRLDPIAFQEFVPGKTEVAAVEAKWGAPVDDKLQNGSGRQSYKVESFKRVEVTFAAGIVESIIVYFEQSMPRDEITRKIVGAESRGVEIVDDEGTALGLAFPERGVMFSYAPTTRRVSQIILEPIDIESFLLRAEQTLHTAPRQSMADVEYVLSKQPKNGKAHWIAAQIYHESGLLSEAAASIDMAGELDPANAAVRLTKAEIISDSGDFTGAGRICAEVLGRPSLAVETRARAHSITADLLANGPQRDAKKALEHHLQAIKLAEPLITHKTTAVRRAAKQVLIEANLGVANDIAWGFFQQKEKVIPKWLVKAHEAAEDSIDQEGADESLHLLVLRRALAASAGTQGKIDPVDWTKEAIRTARLLMQSTDDPWRRHRLEWELGLALYDALQADHARGFQGHALQNSAMVVKYFESAAQHRHQTPHEAYLLGRLYFRVGAIHAIEKKDHRTACTWFDKAAPLLERPLPATAVADVGRLGESFVSMGISCWELGRRDEAIRLTQFGVDLISQGTKDRVITTDALLVPYSNLAFMHRSMGNLQQAKDFESLAARVDGTKRR